MFYHQCRLKGKLTTRTSLCIQSGESYNKQGLNEQKVKVSKVFADLQDKPCIPASTLKGNLHQYGLMHFPGYSELIDDLFGTKEQGGRLLFQDACIDISNSEQPSFFNQCSINGHYPLYWDPERFVYIQNGIALSRITRTTEPNKLFYFETVPEGAIFLVDILAEDISKEHLGFLLHLMEGFNAKEGICLGANTAHGCGALSWEKEEILGLSESDDIYQYLKEDNQLSIFELLPQLSSDIESEYLNCFQPGQSSILSMDISLYFEGPFMVNDPSQSYSSEEGGLSHAYLRNNNGHILLPSRSLHGALRFQAEKIVRTVASDGLAEKKACNITQKGAYCKSVSYLEARQICSPSLAVLSGGFLA